MEYERPTTTNLHRLKGAGQQHTKKPKNIHAIGTPPSPLPITWLCRMLKGDRAVTFLVVVINMVVQLSIFGFYLHAIIDNYYDPLVSREAPFDYFLHHSCFFLFVAFECLTVGLSVWLVVHAGSTVGRWLFDFFVLQFRSQCYRHSSILPFENMNGSRATKKYHHQTNPASSSSPSGRLQRLGHGCLSLIYRPEILVIGLIETVLLVVCGLEAKLLADMAVHFIDLDLVDVMGLKTVSLFFF